MFFIVGFSVTTLRVQPCITDLLCQGTSTVYKADTFLGWTARARPKGVRLNERVHGINNNNNNF